MQINKLSDKKLIELAEEMYISIYQVECYGVNDMILYELAVGELEKRGYTLQTNCSFIKNNEEE